MVSNFTHLCLSELPGSQQFLHMLERSNARGLPVRLLGHVQSQRALDLFDTLLKPVWEHFRIFQTCPRAPPHSEPLQ